MRHATHGDLDRRLTGRGPDGGLSEAGRREAAALADRFAAAPVRRVQCSPSLRTRQTAEAIALPHGLAAEPVDALAELDFGDWQGQAFDDLDEDPRWMRWNARRSASRAPGGESMAEAQARAFAHVRQMAGEATGATVMVTHCDIIRAVLLAVAGRSLDDVHELEAGPASVHPVEPAAILAAGVDALVTR